MKNKLFYKLFSIISAVITAGIVAILTLTVFVLSADNEAETINSLKSKANAISNSLSEITGFRDYSEEMKRMASAFSNIDSSVVFFANDSGYVYVCSDMVNDVECLHRSKMIDADIINQVKFNKDGYAEQNTFNGVYSDNKFTVGAPIYDKQGNFISAVFITAEIQPRIHYTLRILNAIIVPTIVMLAVSFVIVFFVTKSVIRPLSQMSEATKAMANGDFSKRVLTKRKDEIGDLAAHFNKMADSLNSLDTMRNDFVTNVSHDLKTPMTTISGFIDGILDGTIPQKEHKKYLGVVSAEVKRLSNTVNTMLTLSKIESGIAKMQFCLVDIADIVCRVIISFDKALTAKNIDIIGLDKIGKVYVSADENMLFQAVYNIIDNAVKFTQQNGYISIYFSEYNSQIQLYIKNSGEGISDKDIGHVFERFYKTDKSRSVDKSGSGVGLYIVKSIIKRHNGEINVKSLEGQYTEFCIKLPKPHNKYLQRVGNG